MKEPKGNMYYFGILFLLGLVALPFGSVGPIFQWVWVIYIGVFCLIVLLDLLLRKRNYRHGAKPANSAMLVALLLVFWSIIQNTDLAIALFFLPLTTPSSSLATGAISVNVFKSTGSSLFLLSHVVFFFLVVNFCKEKRQAILIIKSIAIIISLYSIYGLIVYFSGNDTVLWFQKSSSKVALSSTFVNRNNFATYGGIGLIALLAWSAGTFGSIDQSRQFSVQIRQFSTKFLGGGGYLILLCFIVGTSILLTGSRAGISSTIVGSVGIIAFGAARPRNFSASFSFKTVIFFISILALFWLSGALFVDRFYIFEYRSIERFDLYSTVITAILAEPFLGYGLGTFEEVIRVFRPLNVDLYFVRAHNEYLEILAGLGIFGFVVMLYISLYLVHAQFQSFKKAVKSRPFIAASIAIITLVALHSLVDFPLQIPAISYTFTAILGAGTSLANRRKI